MKRIEEAGYLYQKTTETSFQDQQQNQEHSVDLSQQMLDQGFLLDQSQEQEGNLLVPAPTTVDLQQVDRLKTEGFGDPTDALTLNAKPILSSEGIKASHLILTDREHLQRDVDDEQLDEYAPLPSSLQQQAAPGVAELPSFQNLLNLSRDFLNTAGTSTSFAVLKDALENMERALKDPELDERARSNALTRVRQAAAAYVSAHDGKVIWSISGRKRRRLAKSILDAAAEAAISTETPATIRNISTGSMLEDDGPSGMSNPMIRDALRRKIKQDHPENDLLDEHSVSLSYYAAEQEKFNLRAIEDTGFAEKINKFGLDSRCLGALGIRYRTNENGEPLSEADRTQKDLLIDKANKLLHENVDVRAEVLDEMVQKVLDWELKPEMLTETYVLKNFKSLKELCNLVITLPQILHNKAENEASNESYYKNLPQNIRQTFDLKLPILLHFTDFINAVSARHGVAPNGGLTAEEDMINTPGYALEDRRQVNEAARAKGLISTTQTAQRVITAFANGDLPDERLNELPAELEQGNELDSLFDSRYNLLRQYKQYYNAKATNRAGSGLKLTSTLQREILNGVSNEDANLFYGSQGIRMERPSFDSVYAATHNGKRITGKKLDAYKQSIASREGLCNDAMSLENGYQELMNRNTAMIRQEYGGNIDPRILRILPLGSTDKELQQNYAVMKENTDQAAKNKIYYAGLKRLLDYDVSRMNYSTPEELLQHWAEKREILHLSMNLINFMEKDNLLDDDSNLDGTDLSQEDFLQAKQKLLFLVGISAQIDAEMNLISNPCYGMLDGTDESLDEDTLSQRRTGKTGALSSYYNAIRNRNNSVPKDNNSSISDRWTAFQGQWANPQENG